MTVEDLVKEAYVNNPQIEQAVLNMQNNLITIRAEQNGMLPVLDAFGYYGLRLWVETPNPNATSIGGGNTATNSSIPGGYGGTLANLFGQNNPDFGVGINFNVPLRNRTAQADQLRSQ